MSAVRIAIENDLPEIVAIYNEAVAGRFRTADLVPVSVESRQAWFAEHTPKEHPIYVYQNKDGSIAGWAALSPYRPGRMALRFTAELSYFVRKDSFRKGIASTLIQYAMDRGAALSIKTVFAIVLEPNHPSRRLLEKKGFANWGVLPAVADFDGRECGHIYYGRRLEWAGLPKLEIHAFD